jgi:hypothetical protein
MARRNIESYRSSTQQIAPQQGIENQSHTLADLAAVGQEIIKVGQEAKITENFSKAQLDLNRLNTQYQIDFENDPFNEEGLSVLKQNRDDVFKSYGDQISPFFKRQWDENIRGLAIKDDAEIETWAFSQTKKNTVRSINQSIKNNMSQATVDGQNFGGSDTDEIGSMLNYAASKQNLASFGDKNLGAGTTTDLLESYDDNYLKSFIGGVSDTNPIKALRLIENPDVQKKFKDQSQFLKMKEAVETKALQAEKIYTQQEVLNVLKDENSLLGQSLKTNISYVDLQKEFSDKKISPSAQDYFLKANGFRTEKGEEKLTKSEKLQEQVSLYDAVTVAASSEDITPENISALQDRVYKAMDRGVLTDEEGAEYINQFVSPIVAGKEQQLSKYQTGKWNPWQDNIGYSGLNDLIEQVTIASPEGEEAGPAMQNLNNERKLKLYNFYSDQLKEAASVRNIKIGDLPSLSYSEKKKVYSDAQVKAKKLYLADEYPELGNLKDDQWPDSIVTEDGRKIKTGVASPKPTGKVVSPKAQYEFATEAEMEAAGLPDGTPVMLNGVSGIYRK